MKVNKLIPMIYTRELEETINFYTNTLGFICGNKNDVWGWAAMHLGEVDLMVAKPNVHTPFDKPGFTGTFYFNINHVDALWQELKEKFNIVYPIENFDWEMREFAILDNNGYMLQFGQDIKPK